MSPSLASNTLLSDSSINGITLAAVVLGSCTINNLYNSSSALCEEVLPNSLFNYEYNGWIDRCMKYASCATTIPTIRGTSQCSNETNQLFGKISEPSPPDTELGATIWFNPRVSILECIVWQHKHHMNNA